MITHRFSLPKQASLGELVRTLPARQLLLQWLAIFSTFSIIAFMIDTMFILFMNATATRYLRVQTELAVAHEIHRILVPPIRHTIGDYEFFGWSIASGEVGGDLVDVVDSDGKWLGYVADVSGHGVASGIVMGMFKSALRIRVLADSSVAVLLGAIQAALMPLKQPNMFVTVACVRGREGSELECAVAGHLPILHVCAGVVDEISTPQLAVGMFANATFVSTSVECRSGDVLALMSDGLIMVTS